MSGTGGVRNLRAMFENKPSEDRPASPPSRGQSPALSEASVHSRPVSKVRASFVVVERPDDTEEGQHWGLRKASDVTTMADTKQELENISLVNSVSNTPTGHARSNGVHNNADPPLRQTATNDTTQDGLGIILKGSAFEASPPTSRSDLKGPGAREPPTSPTSQRKNLAASKTNGKITPGTQHKSIGSKMKEAVSLNHHKPPPPTKLNITKEAKPIKKPPPTRQVPPAKSSAKSPTSPRTPRVPMSPKLEKPITRGSASKPVAVAESAKTVATSEQAEKPSISPREAEKPPTSPRHMRRTSLNTPSPTAARHDPSSPKTNGLKKVAKPSSPEAKPKSTRVPTSAAAPTAASAARGGNTSTLGRKPTTTRRDPPPTKTGASTAPAVKKVARTSLPAQTNGTDRTKPRISAAKRAPGEGFLARMMRPTASSAQKAHEKVAPSSPPQSKRATPLQAAKSKARRSMTVSDEDKENSHRGGQESNPSASAAEETQVETNGDGKGESQPLNDITPAVEPQEVPADSNTDALEASTA